jgi:hypothetical protein
VHHKSEWTAKNGRRQLKYTKSITVGIYRDRGIFQGVASPISTVAAQLMENSPRDALRLKNAHGVP